MAYDWTGGRVRRFRQLKLAMLLGGILVGLLVLSAFYRMMM
jgi:hypothetical protein